MKEETDERANTTGGSMNIIKDGYLKGSFRGYRNRDTVFEFTDGRIWRQAEYRYHYHYAYRPQAVIIEDAGAYYIKVDGIDGKLRVARIS